MSTNLKRIGEKARRNRVWCSPACITTSRMWTTCGPASTPKGRKGGGSGRRKKAEYGKHLEENLQDLSARLKRMGYRPQPKRRSYIPKPGSEKGRPLGISNFEDKIVELAAKRMLEPIYEAVFEDCSYGYRPGRSQHHCLDALGRTIQQKRVNYVVEADIRGFFDHVNHEWMLKFLQHRIGDPRVIRLIIRMLKAASWKTGLVQATRKARRRARSFRRCCPTSTCTMCWTSGSSDECDGRCRGEAYLFRYADDCAPGNVHAR